MEEQKKTDADYVLSVDLADKPSEAVHVEMAAKEVGDIQLVDLPKDVPKVIALGPECAGPVDSTFEGAFEINRVFYGLSLELLNELDRILSVEEQEHEVLVQAMIEEADKWARAEISKIKGESNNKVRTFISLENSDIQDARHTCKEDKKRAKANTKKDMKILQEKLTEFLKMIEDTLEAELVTIRTRFKDIYKRVDDDSKSLVDQTMSSLADFTNILQGLTLEQLQELKQSGVLRLGREQVSVPGAVQLEEGTDV